jgi:hypothetical protein
MEESPVRGFMKSRQKSVYEHMDSKKEKSGMGQYG